MVARGFDKEIPSIQCLVQGLTCTRVDLLPNNLSFHDMLIQMT